MSTATNGVYAPEQRSGLATFLGVFGAVEFAAGWAMKKAADYLPVGHSFVEIAGAGFEVTGVVALVGAVAVKAFEHARHVDVIRRPD